MPARPTLLLISNGHGEDVVGSRLARALAEARPELELVAFPTVGEGRAYGGGPARRIGPLRTLPAAGLTVRNAAALARDLRAGLLAATAAQLRDLRALRPAIVVTVGDVWVETLGLLPRARARFAVQTLVSCRMAGSSPAVGLGAFRERFTVLERTLLRVAYRRAYLRDDASAAALRASGVAAARSLGNPMMDELEADPLPLAASGPRLLLLPGSRAWAGEALARMSQAVARLPGATAVAAWSAGPTPSAPPGWREAPGRFGGPEWRRGDVRLLLARDRFAPALAWAEAAIGTTGTAQEQAAGRGRPVVAFPLPPDYPAAFLATQRRLLGDALIVSEARPDAVAAATAALLADPAELRRRAAVGRARMGPAGGSRAIAADLLGAAVDAGALPPDAERGRSGVASWTGEPA